MPRKSLPAKKAEQGEKMIEIRVRFWTNKLADGKDMILPKEGWTGGFVSIQNNDAHGIKATKPVPFRSLMHLPSVIEQVLIDHGITLHPSAQTRRYFPPTD